MVVISVINMLIVLFLSLIIYVKVRLNTALLSAFPHVQITSIPITIILLVLQELDLFLIKHHQVVCELKT